MTELRLLFVCTGNICRSPMAQRFAAGYLAERLPPADAARVLVGSAGTYGPMAGSPMEPAAVAALDERGVPPIDFTSRELVADLVEQADLVLTAAREHRAAAVQLVPRAAAKTFTIREFARLCAGVDPAGLPTGDVVERGRALVKAAAAQRGLHPPDAPADDDVADPYRRSTAHYRAAAETITEALRGPLDLLVPPHGVGR